MLNYTRRSVPEDKDHIFQCAIDWAMEAGRIQLDKFRSRRRLAMTTKSSLHDIVTEVDEACETLLIGKINETFPGHSIVGEETGVHKRNSDWEWVLDPLDGTTNYSQGLPIFSVSIGVKYKGETQVGVVYIPFMDEVFAAKRGEGATWNGRSIHVSRKTDLNQCVCGTGFPYDKGSNSDNNLDNLSVLLPHLRGIRRMGSAAYDLCCVASGMLDAYWELNLKPWDVCAGALIVEEAGGVVRSFREDRDISIVAGSEKLVDKVMSLMQTVRK